MKIEPALLLAARRGFIYAYVEGGSGTFQDDDVQRAENFFDDHANDGEWSEAFYENYAQLDPWKQDA